MQLLPLRERSNVDCRHPRRGGRRLGGKRRSRPAYQPIDAVKHGPARPLYRNTFRAHAPPKDSALRRIESKEIRRARRIFMSKVLFLKRVRVLPKKAASVFFAVKVQARSQN